MMERRCCELQLFEVSEVRSCAAASPAQCLYLDRIELQDIYNYTFLAERYIHNGVPITANAQTPNKTPRDTTRTRRLGASQRSETNTPALCA